MRVGSLFAGIGGFDLGLERAGMRVRWQCEINEWCRRVLAKHWPDVVRYGDITTIDWSTVEPVDVLCGGFPCQDISLAGKGAGLSGERSGLWFEMLRVVREVGPRFVLVENSPALTCRGLGTVLGDLASLGYDAKWGVLGAHHAGAPHKRDRIWIVANSLPSWKWGITREAEAQGNVVANADKIGCGQVEQSITYGKVGEKAASETEHGCIATRGTWWASEPGLGRVANGVANRVDRLRCIGNGQVPAVVKLAWGELT